MKTFETACVENSDIYKHLPILKEYASKCNSILEIGFGFGNSNLAFIASGCSFIRTIEIDDKWNLSGIQNNKEYAKQNNVDYDIIYGDSRDINTFNKCKEVDFLFVDGDHSFLTVRKELELYPTLVKKYIGFHDVVTFGYRDMIITPGNDKHGINWAIEEFLIKNPNWKIDYVSIFNNGLLILKNDNI